MTRVAAYAAAHATADFAARYIERRIPGPTDVEVAIRYCGVCHSDLHQVRDEWGGSIFPMVPGPEIIGTVMTVGAQVTRFTPGATVGVGCMVDSCRTCASCSTGLEQYCEHGFSPTYNGYEQDGKTPTYGGYSERIVVDQAFVLHIDAGLDPAGAAPLLCAGITTYSPLRHWEVGKQSRVAIIGLGGLGHMGVKFAHALGAEVVVFTRSADKQADALRLGADDVMVTNQTEAFEQCANTFDFVLDTVSAPHDINACLRLLKRDGCLCLVGVPPTPPEIKPFDLIMKRRTIAGSLIGGLPETQEMLDFCGQHRIVSDVELIAMPDIEQAYVRMLKGQVNYRFVIDMQSLPSPGTI
jgi:alcohol dehydrogenase (NADP+)